LKMDFSQTISVDEGSIEERIAHLEKRNLEKELNPETLKLIMSMLDLTTLEGNDTEEKVKQLCIKEMNRGDGIPHVAAVCVYPNLVRTAKKVLKNSPVKVASVAGGFPSGMTSKEIKVAEVKWAISEGADEIDVVISRGKFLEGEYNYVFDEIAEIKSACGKALLKVILETGELGTLDNIRKASDIAISAGADFIKTSTGKIQPGATLPATLVMLDAIHDHYSETGKRIGIKPAGGIKTAEQAIQYLILVRETMGNDWLTPQLFRFGASSLMNDLVIQIEKKE
jgi:deoxyribose-phosphate aldolase